MNLEEITAGLSQPRTLVERILSESNQRATVPLQVREAAKRYTVAAHDVLNIGLRPDKTVYKEIPNGTDELNNTKYTTVASVVRVNRLAIPLQKLLVSRAVAFITGGGVQITSNADGAQAQSIHDAIVAAWDDNKIAFRNATIAKLALSEMECAEIWYSRKDDDNATLRCKIVAPSLGYTLCPVFNDEDDLVAFGMHYTAGKRARFDIYTKDARYRFEHDRLGGGWALAEEAGVVELPYKKLPVVYYRVTQPLWADVQTLIARLEDMLSNLADSNDYTFSPVLAFVGQVTGMSAKGTPGRSVQLENGADVKYVSYDNAPESVKMELERLIELIYVCTQVPNISFQEMKGLGDISGAAWDRIMIDAHLMATDAHAGWYGEGIQRRLNFLKAAVQALPGVNASDVVAAGLSIKPVFSLFRMDDVNEKIDTAMKANGGKAVISQRESIELAGMSRNVDKTLEEITAGEGAAA